MPSSNGTVRVVWNDFSGGDYGQLGGEKAPANSFRAQNMIVTADGDLMPRPGWRDRSPADLPVGKVVTVIPTVTPGRNMVVGVGDTLYAYELNTPGDTVEDIGSFDVTPTLALLAKQGTTEYYVTIPGDKTYLISPPVGTVTALAGSPGGRELEVYGQRLIVTDNATPYMLWFSDPADFNSWPAENFIQVGDNWQITSIRAQKNGLTIYKRNGAYFLTGVPGTSSAFVRKMDRGYGPLHPGQLTIDEHDLIWLLPAFNLNPASFDTSAVDQVSYLKELGTVRDGDTPALPLVLGFAEAQGDKTPSSIMLAQGGGTNILLINHNGIWTRHVVGFNITGMVRGGYNSEFYITDGGSVSTSGKIYSTLLDLDRPALTTDGLVQPGDGTDTALTAWVVRPQWWSPDAHDVAVSQVIVDFTKYNTGSSSTNHFEVEIGVLGRTPVTQGDITLSGTALTWNEVGTGAGASIGNSRRDRAVLSPERVFGSGIEIKLNNVRGIKINSVTFELEKSALPRS